MDPILSQSGPGAALDLCHRPSDASLWVTVCAPSFWDLQPAPTWPRTPGSVTVVRDPERDRVWCCAGYLPCGDCEPCRAALHMACLHPIRPGWNHPGGLATRLALPDRFLAPLPHLDLSEAALLAATLAAAGPTYQAAVLAGMAPGDTVLVLGSPGPGALPLRLLVAMGLRPVWITAHPEPVPQGVMQTLQPDPDRLPSPRCHVLDLQPTPTSIAIGQTLAGTCLSVALLGPGPLPRLDAEQLLRGQAVLRWVRDLHPHLVLDLLALTRSPTFTSGELQSGGASEQSRPFETVDMAGMIPAFTALSQGRAPAWPVLVNASPTLTAR